MTGGVRDKDRDAARDDTLRRFLLPIGAVIGLAIVVFGTAFLYDKNGAENLLAGIYQLLGNNAGATALRNGGGDQFVAKLVLAAMALLVGVGGVWLLYTGVSAVVGLLSLRKQQRIIPWVFVLPAITLLGIYLVYPTIATIYQSFTHGNNGAALANPLANYATLGTQDFPHVILNNVIWLVVATSGSVGLGLLIAGLVDRVKREALAKTFIFLPLAISLVGASVIWQFVYAYRPPGAPQYGLFNAIYTAAGGQPLDWVHTQPINTYLLIVIMVWLQTGFSMVILSAAIKGVSTEVVEAARLDGANERQLFFRVIVPMIKGSIITVATTVAIAVLKIFDIVYVMTGGRSGTDVIANRMYDEVFQFNQPGIGAALAVILLIAVLPVMYINLRNLRHQGVGA